MFDFSFSSVFWDRFILYVSLYFPWLLSSILESNRCLINGFGWNPLIWKGGPMSVIVHQSKNIFSPLLISIVSEMHSVSEKAECLEDESEVTELRFLGKWPSSKDRYVVSEADEWSRTHFWPSHLWMNTSYCALTCLCSYNLYFPLCFQKW